MVTSPVGASDLGAPVFVQAARCASTRVRLLAVATAFARFGTELERLCRRADPATAMTFSPAWSRAVPPPRGYAHRLLLLHQESELCAAVCLRERTVFHLPTGILHGSDAKGEGMVLCPAGEEGLWLAAAVQALFDGRRSVALLLDRPAGCDGIGNGVAPLSHGLQQRSQPTRFRWRTELCPSFDDTLAPLGHRTRRNLRHALRRAADHGWQFLPELTPAEVSEATTELATRSTHPYTGAAIAARLQLERSHKSSFSMGLRGADGVWLSLVSGVRRTEGTADIFWQANVASGHDSVAIAMRALLMRHEGARGSRALRYIGGTSPLLERSCQADGGVQALITRRGLRLHLLDRFLRTRFASEEHPVRRLLQVAPSAG